MRASSSHDCHYNYAVEHHPRMTLDGKLPVSQSTLHNQIHKHRLHTSMKTLFKNGKLTLLLTVTPLWKKLIDDLFTTVLGKKKPAQTARELSRPVARKNSHLNH